MRGVNLKMIRPYDFVPFLRYIPYNGGKIEHKEGKIPIRVKTLTPIHISSGEYVVDYKSIVYKEFIKVNDVPVIPATSLKGCIRSIAESISNSYLYIYDKKRNKLIPEWKIKLYNDSGKKAGENKIKGQNKEEKIKCIVCDMFGQMGQKSKVLISDLKGIDNKYRLEIKGIPPSFGPNPENEYYLENGKYKGYKFYRHGINGIQPKGNIFCEFVTEDSWFEGEIIYRNLTEDQMQLLCFSLGLSGDFNPKIGYGKNYFYGSIEVTSDDKWVEKANQYKINSNPGVRKNIDILTSILSFKNALRTLE